MSKNSKVQLFCLPFAGGSRSTFDKFKTYLREDIEIIQIEYPGHDSRIKEKLCENMEELIEDAYRQIANKRDVKLPYALLGYSMGSIVVYEILCKIWNSSTNVMGVPFYVFFCAIEALSNFKPRIYFDDMSHEEIIYILKNMGGINESILKDNRFLEAFLRPVKADYRILADYGFDKAGNKLPDVDCSILFSSNDIPYAKVEGWEELTLGSVEFFELGNNHFFINDCPENMAELVNKKMLNYRFEVKDEL